MTLLRDFDLRATAVGKEERAVRAGADPSSTLSPLPTAIAVGFSPLRGSKSTLLLDPLKSPLDTTSEASHSGTSSPSDTSPPRSDKETTTRRRLELPWPAPGAVAVEEQRSPSQRDSAVHAQPSCQCLHSLRSIVRHSTSPWTLACPTGPGERGSFGVWPPGLAVAGFKHNSD